jgi:hypothetical protein
MCDALQTGVLQRIVAPKDTLHGINDWVLPPDGSRSAHLFSRCADPVPSQNWNQ